LLAGRNKNTGFEVGRDGAELVADLEPLGLRDRAARLRQLACDVVRGVARRARVVAVLVGRCAEAVVVYDGRRRGAEPVDERHDGRWPQAVLDRRLGKNAD
jgi:hypothetical protein